VESETARHLAANGVKVVVNGRHEKALDGIVADIRKSGAEVFGCVADCTKYDEIERLRELAEERFGIVDLLLAFAGGDGNPEPIDQLSEERWDAVVSANLKSKFLTVKSFLPSMRKKRAGSIVLMCSSAGRIATGASLAYSSAQGGVVMLSRSLAQQLGKDGIRVNAIAPATIRNRKIETFMSSEDQGKFAKSFAIPRLGNRPTSPTLPYFYAPNPPPGLPA
jgi:3-oxoacyl-[acyl-carrier protein] reductase